jgi:uncharacterized membrane protein
VVRQSKESTKEHAQYSKYVWIIVYMAAMIVVYGLIYLLFIHKGGHNSLNGGWGY